MATGCPVKDGKIVVKGTDGAKPGGWCPFLNLNNEKWKLADYRNCIFKDDMRNLAGVSLEAYDWCTTKPFTGCEKCRVCHPKKEKDDYCNGNGLPPPTPPPPSPPPSPPPPSTVDSAAASLVLASFGAVMVAMWAHVGNGIVGI